MKVEPLKILLIGVEVNTKAKNAFVVCFLEWLIKDKACGIGNCKDCNCRANIEYEMYKLGEVIK